MFHWLEQRPFFFAVAVFLTVAFAGIIEIIPDFAKQSQPVVGTKPYSMLELAGRQVYIKDSCNACHSQMIRPNHMMDPASVVPGTVMPAYPHMFENKADIATAYANANTQKQVFAVPYDQEGMPKLGSWSEAKVLALEEAKLIVADMKNQEVKNAVANGTVPEIVALIAYLNSLK